MIQVRDIYSLTDFQRKTREHIDRLKETGRPEVLTVNGRAEIVVQDAESYERLMETVERAEAIVGIRRGLDSLYREEGRSASESLRSIRARNGVEGEG